MDERRDFEKPIADERRFEPRLTKHATVFVERMAAAYDNSQPADIVIGNSLDVSASGMRIRMDNLIPPGTILRMCAQFNDDRQPLYIVGEVKWQRRETGQYCIGFELFDSEQTDIKSWKESIVRQLDR